MPNTSDDSDILRYEEVSIIYKFPLNTLYSMVSRREIPHFRLGGRCVRFSRSELDGFFKAHHIDSAQNSKTK